MCVCVCACIHVHVHVRLCMFVCVSMSIAKKTPLWLGADMLDTNSPHAVAFA